MSPSNMSFEYSADASIVVYIHVPTYDGNGWWVECQRGHLIGWRTGKLVVRFVTLVRDFTLCFVSVVPQCGILLGL